MVVLVAVVASAVERLRGDGNTDNLGVFLECKITTLLMIESNISLTTSTLPLLSIGVAELIVTAIVILMHFMDALTPNYVWWRNRTNFFISSSKEFSHTFYEMPRKKKNINDR